MKRLFIIFFFCVNSWGLTVDELVRLEKTLATEPMAPIAPSSFIKECYDLVAMESNPRYVKFLSQLLDMAQSKGSEEVSSYLSVVKNILKSE